MKYETIHEAASKGDLADIELHLQDGADVNTRDATGMTPLMWATINNRLDVAQILVEQGADVNARDKKGATPLMRAMMMAMFTYELDMAKFLLAHGADADTRVEDGVTPLMMATGMGKLDIVKFLVAEGAHEKRTATSPGVVPITPHQRSIGTTAGGRFEKQSVPDPDRGRSTFRKTGGARYP